jgi:predicted flap endonuclease-1-like 5' DNA nuclease
MTPELTDPQTLELIEKILRSWPREKDELGELLSERTGRIHVAGHLVMAEILGVSAVGPSFDWPRYCTSKRAFSLTQRIDRAPAGTAERGVLETDVLICLAGVAAESIDDAVNIDQWRARLERAAAQEYLRSVEDDEKVRHYWLAYLFELARAELSNGWHEVVRAEGRLISLAGPAAPPKPQTRARPILPYAVFQTVRDAVVDRPKQEREPPVRDAVANLSKKATEPRQTPEPDTDRRQRNAAYIDDGMLDSRLDVFGLPPRYVKSLRSIGVMTVRDLISLRRDEMEQVRGIGEKGARAIEAVLNSQRYTYMPGDYPERWRRCAPGDEEEAALAWKTDPSAPLESVGMDRLLGRALCRANIHCVRDLLARSESDLAGRKHGLSDRQLASIEEAMRQVGYILAGPQFHRRWQRADQAGLGQESHHSLAQESDPYGPLEMLSLPDRVIEALHTGKLYTIADLLATSEQYFGPLGINTRGVSAITSAMLLKGFVLIGVPEKRRFVRIRG